ncbi:hypothetical protein ES319_D04G107300v1 [Gossypium barbadense]|uniref:NADH-plastoquinone oxidoreductase subunit 1 n=1 Tax=Gossypium barbadense TaxID=3634 RepID=A0A5J5S1I7_GOSBA|nr:hypothetical protein ES319_D04G107300v1 [Gossypium barbadense]
MLVSILTLIFGITIGVLVIVWLEREISTVIQQRIGLEYAGPLGILQALADGTKLLFKESILPSRGNTHLFCIGPAIADISILLSFSVIPFSSRLILADLNICIFLWIAISRYGSNNKYSFLGGLRAAAQSISYEIPLTLYVLSLSLLDIVEAQSKYGFWGWNLWRQPISSLLGGWNISIPYVFIPELFEINKINGIIGTTIGIFITLAKTYLFLFISIATRWTLPRLRMDQLLNLGWKFLLPISLGNLLLTTSSQLLSL